MKLCKDCGINERHSANGKAYSYCQGCQNARSRARYLANKELVKEKRKQHYQNNKGSILEYKKRYRKDNPDIKRRAEARRRARKLENGFEHYTEQQVLDLYGINCHICNKLINLKASRYAGADGWEDSLHLDHVTPISKGGPDTLDNVRPAHAICNLQKSDSML